jgi:hypothetical protein
MEWASGCPLCEHAFHSIKIFGEGMLMACQKMTTGTWEQREQYRNEELQGSTCGNNIMTIFIECGSCIPSRRFKGFEVWFYNSGIEIIPVFIHAEGKLANSVH